jgi:hypothetical protein
LRAKQRKGEGLKERNIHTKKTRKEDFSFIGSGKIKTKKVLFYNNRNPSIEMNESGYYKKYCND